MDLKWTQTWSLYGIKNGKEFKKHLKYEYDNYLSHK